MLNQTGLSGEMRDRREEVLHFIQWEAMHELKVPLHDPSSFM